MILSAGYRPRYIFGTDRMRPVLPRTVSQNFIRCHSSVLPLCGQSWSEESEKRACFCEPITARLDFLCANDGESALMFMFMHAAREPEACWYTWVSYHCRLVFYRNSFLRTGFWIQTQSSAFNYLSIELFYIPCLKTWRNDHHYVSRPKHWAMKITNNH